MWRFHAQKNAHILDQASMSNRIKESTRELKGWEITEAHETKDEVSLCMQSSSLCFLKLLSEHKTTFSYI